MTSQMQLTEPGAATTRSGLHWIIKPSFIRYIESMSDGEIWVFDGAERLSDGSFYFPLVNEDVVGDTRTRTFRGTVQFTGHRGMLVVTLADIRIEEKVDAARLSIADALMPNGRLEMLDLRVGELNATESRYSSSALTEDGADLFFENYPIGTDFGPSAVTH